MVILLATNLVFFVRGYDPWIVPMTLARNKPLANTLVATLNKSGRPFANLKTKRRIPEETIFRVRAFLSR